MLVGSNRLFLLVTAEDGTTYREYSISVVRADAEPITSDEPFISVWKTDNTGATSDNQISLPLIGSGSYGIDVDWGDGTESHIDSFGDPEKTHTFPEAGVYVVRITGTFIGFGFNRQYIAQPYPNDSNKLIEVRNWGGISFGDFGGGFFSCENLIVTATDTPVLTATTDLSFLFYSCSEITAIPNIENWSVHTVNDMEQLFSYASMFDQDLGNWDVSSVTTMKQMFYRADSFNQDIGGWTVSNVIDMRGMFTGYPTTHSEFNQDLSEWDVSKVTDMGYMFCCSDSFDQSLAAWDISAVENMENMFSGVT